MKIELDVAPETAQKLAAAAQSQGISLGQLVSSFAESLSKNPISSGPDSMTKATQFRSWAASHPNLTTPLSDQAMSRDSIYQ